MNTQIEVDLGLERVSNGALAMLERVSWVSSLPSSLFSKLLDALVEEHLRRFGAQLGVAAMLRVPMRTLDLDELWHSLRVLGNWLSSPDEASHGDPDLEAASEIIARMWLAMRSALGSVTDSSIDQMHCEANN